MNSRRRWSTAAADYDREMAFIAESQGEGGAEEILGVARACADPDNVAGEFAVMVRPDLKRQGLGRLLMQKLMRYCRRAVKSSSCLLPGRSYGC